MREAGAHTLAQDEASSVVWGMPRAAVELDAACDVLALEDMPHAIVEALSDRRRSTPTPGSHVTANG